MKEDIKKFITETEKDLHTMTLNEIACLGAQNMLKMALAAEVQAHLDQYKDSLLIGGKPALVLNGSHLPRKVTVGEGQVTVSVPRTRRRNSEVENYASSIIPKYIRRSPKIDEVIPLLYLKGISTGNMLPALKQLLGEDVSGLSAANVTRLKQCWKKEYEQWKRRDLSDRRYCYLWVDGIHTSVRFSEARLCTLVVIGATEAGTKELVAVESGYRESKQSWSMLLRDLLNRGMNAPCLAIGDGALGFWAAVSEIYPGTRWQRCWVHKVSNVLDKMPKLVQRKAKGMLTDIYMAEKKAEAERLFKQFVDTFGEKYYKAVECLKKDKKHLLAFYDFPAKHWKHIRTTNPIESTFATVRLRTNATRGHGTEETTFMMIYKLLKEATKRWQRMWGYNLIPLVLNNEIFVDGELKEAA